MPEIENARIWFDPTTGRLQVTVQGPQPHANLELKHVTLRYEQDHGSSYETTLNRRRPLHAAGRREDEPGDTFQFRVCQSPHGVVVDWTDVADGCMQFVGEAHAGRPRIEFRTARPEGRAPEAADSLAADGRALLAVLAAAPEPMLMIDACDAVAPMPPSRDARTREHRQWLQRSHEVANAWLDLLDAGLIRETVRATAGRGSGYEITGIGRVALAGAERAEGRDDD